MCNFFSCLVVYEVGQMQVYFSHSDSHEDLITALDLKDSRFNGNFVRVEVDPKTFDIDIQNDGYTPDWIDMEDLRQQVKFILHFVYPEWRLFKDRFLSNYESSCAERDQLWRDFEEKTKGMYYRSDEYQGLLIPYRNTSYTIDYVQRESADLFTIMYAKAIKHIPGYIKVIDGLQDYI